MIEVVKVTKNDNLKLLCSKINSSKWDDKNDMGTYTEEALLNYFKNNKNALFLACYIENDLAGVASGVVLQKPYSRELWLYVDEVDVAVPHRRKGVGKTLMQEFIKIAKEEECKEIWLGTETDNAPANILYKSLNPTEIEEFTGYTYKTSDLLE